MRVAASARVNAIGGSWLTWKRNQITPVESKHTPFRYPPQIEYIGLNIAIISIPRLVKKSPQ
jgi:hypothetical protein